MFSCKVWTANRVKKRAIMVRESTDLVTVLAKGSEKLGITGKLIVLERDGTVIDDAEIFSYYVSKDSPFIILQDGEEWYKLNDDSTSNSENKLLNNNLIETVPDLNLTNNAESTFNGYDDYNGNIVDPENKENTFPHATGNEEVLADAQEVHVDLAEVETRVTNERIKAYLDERRGIFKSWEEYSVPWEKLKNEDLQKLIEGTTNESMKSSVVDSIVQDMRSYKVRISRNAFRQVAVQLMKQFPNTFEDRKEDGSRLGNGYHFLERKLIDHNGYLSRDHKTGVTLSANLNMSLKSTKLMSSMQAGCLLWKPKNWGHKDKDDQEQLRIELFSLVYNDIENQEQRDACLEKLTSSFDAQRAFFNVLNTPRVNHIFENWPILLQKQPLLSHFKKLTGKDIEKSSENMEERIFKILFHGFHKQKREFPQDSSEDFQRNEVVSILQKQFGEPVTTWITSYPITTLEEDAIASPENPSIVVIEGGEDAESEENIISRYWLALDGVKIELCEDFFAAIRMMIASYFVFNRTYASNNAASLEFIQMYLCNIETNDYTRGRQAKYKSKALTCIKQLRKIKIQDFANT